MKFYTIAMFIFIFNIALAMVNATSMFTTTGYSITQEQKLIDDASTNAETKSTETDVLSTVANYISAIGDYASSFVRFTASIAFAPVAIVDTLSKILHIETTDKTMIALSGLLYFVYIGALIQFMGNRSFKNMS